MINIINKKNQINKSFSRNCKRGNNFFSFSSINLKTCKSQSSKKNIKEFYFQHTNENIKKIMEKRISNRINNLQINNIISRNNDDFEILNYKYKQLQRDFLLLEKENKILNDKIKRLNKNINESKEKEIKIMKILFRLSKTFKIKVDDYLENDINYDNLNESKNSLNFSSEFLYNSIIYSNTNKLVKPINVPKLNLMKINYINNK